MSSRGSSSDPRSTSATAPLGFGSNDQPTADRVALAVSRFQLQRVYDRLSSMGTEFENEMKDIGASILVISHVLGDHDYALEGS